MIGTTFCSNCGHAMGCRKHFGGSLRGLGDNKCDECVECNPDYEPFKGYRDWINREVERLSV